jgi:hypothetical protein
MQVAFSTRPGVAAKAITSAAVRACRRRPSADHRSSRPHGVRASRGPRLPELSPLHQRLLRERL